MSKPSGVNRTREDRTSVTSLASPGSALEPVEFKGDLTVKSLFARDLDFGNSSLVLLIDMNGVVGVGRRTGTQYVLTSQESTVRPLTSHQNVEFTFPMATGADAPISAVRTGVARLVMNVDLDTGSITSLAASLRAA